MFSKSRSRSVWLLPIFLLIIDLTKTNLSSNIFSLDSASCNDIVIVLKSSKESVGRKSRDSGGLVKPTFPSKSYNLILVTMHFCVTCRLWNHTKNHKLFAKFFKFQNKSQNFEFEFLTLFAFVVLDFLTKIGLSIVFGQKCWFGTVW